MDKLEAVFKSPLATVTGLKSEEFISYAQRLDAFFLKEYCLLRTKVDDIQQNLSYYHSIAEEFKSEKSERKRHVLEATERMLYEKIKELALQEKMLILALKQEEKKLTRDTERILKKYELL